MVRFANIRPEQINKARRMLQDLPEKIERKTRQEAALLLESDLRKALKADCTQKVNRGLAQKRKPHDSCFAHNKPQQRGTVMGQSILLKFTGNS